MINTDEEEIAQTCTGVTFVQDDIIEDGEEDHTSRSSIEDEIGKEETRMVNYSKALVAVVIVVVAVAMGILVFLYMKFAEELAFKSQFGTVANEIIELADVGARNIFDSLDSMSTTITSHVLAVGDTWPFVSMPDFEVQGMVSNKATGASVLSVIPIVQAEDREKWENFTVTNTNWISKGLMYQLHMNTNFHNSNSHHHQKQQQQQQQQQQWPQQGIDAKNSTKEGGWEKYQNNNTVEDWEKYAENNTIEEGGWQQYAKTSPLDIVPYIYYRDHETYGVHREDELDFYLPSWLVTPTPLIPYVNSNLRHFDLDNYLVGMIENDQPVLSPIVDARWLPRFYPDRFDPEDIGKPHSHIIQPIYDNFFENRTIVASLGAFLRWDNFFVNLLPESEQGIILVLHGSCGDVYTYQINGFQTKYLGEGDLHDTRYDDMERIFEFASFATLKETEERSFCKYSAKIYPSEEWGERFFSNKPLCYAMIVCSCFFLTSLVFVVYDCMVQKRQKKVMDSATKTNAIVTSLFPSNVRERLIAELERKYGDGANDGESNKKDSFLTEKENGSRSMTSINSNSFSTIETSESIFGSQPIADLFPNATIMFADMVGFTSWSSVREPCQVFTLLETVYHSFDKIAKKMSVFKVETIGDCYVAVVGLPTPRDNHAVVMAEFASKCMAKMTEMANILQHSLGRDTADLSMRIGLHSGPVTAGVLRGDKGRFQLFGDAVNTTSRIETTGIQGKIHISNETAELLIDAGKGHWVVPREDTVFAKGKGELQTYWLCHIEDSTMSLSTSVRSGDGNC